MNHPVSGRIPYGIFSTFLPSATRLRRLCFYTCLSVILFTGGGSTWAGTPLGVGTPQEQVHSPRSRYTPREGTPRAGTPGSRYTPQAGTPLVQVHPPADGYCCGRYASYWNAFFSFKCYCYREVQHQFFYIVNQRCTNCEACNLLLLLLLLPVVEYYYQKDFL